MAPKRESGKLVAENRKARFNYDIEEKLEAGIVLTGSEVKSLRAGRANIAESYATEEGGELYLINAHIAEYPQATVMNHEPGRPRKLLIRKRQREKFAEAATHKGLTLVPLAVYFSPRGIVKVSIAVAKGRKLHDKREKLKKQTDSKEMRDATLRRR